MKDGLSAIFSRCLCVMAGVMLAAVQASAAEVLRREISEGAVASVMHGRRLGLEVQPPGNKGSQRFLQNFLAIESTWVAYTGAARSFIPFDQLKAETQRQILLTIYPGDFIDQDGWTHTVVDDGETLVTLCEWITGNGLNYRVVESNPRNNLQSSALKRGQRILIPVDLLRGVMKTPTPKPAIDPIIEEEILGDALTHTSDREGPVAIYKLRKGEALYTAVVARFTDYRETADILAACDVIAKRSKIRDVHDIHTGAKIAIPREMLSTPYLPEGTEEKREYIASLEESKRLRATQAISRDLSDVVVILDPGHGGSDPGSMHAPSGLYEDEINYDIVCRIKVKLEAETAAKVYVTMRDRSQGYTPTDATKFSLDKDEDILTSPPYPGNDPTVSVNLRYMLVNSIYQKELARGVDSRKIVFTSVHTDSLHPSLRGSMVYIPGAKFRRASERRNDAVYASYSEGRNFNNFTSSDEERRFDEATSRNFALELLQHLGANRIKRHDHGDPIRSQINQRNQKPYVPGVIRNAKVPTKILIETANLQNETDRKWLSDPWWRQQFADAYVEAVKAHYRPSPPLRTAKSAD